MQSPLEGWKASMPLAAAVFHVKFNESSAYSCEPLLTCTRNIASWVAPVTSTMLDCRRGRAELEAVCVFARPSIGDYRSVKQSFIGMPAREGEVLYHSVLIARDLYTAD